MDHKLHIAIKALKKIRDRQGIVCREYSACKHTSCRSSHASWKIADEALAVIEGINKDGCIIYKDISELGVHKFYKEHLQDWLKEGKGIAVYSKLSPEELVGKSPIKKYCSFGTRFSTIPDCDSPPVTMPKRNSNVGPLCVYYLIGYIPKPVGKQQL